MLITNCYNYFVFLFFDLYSLLFIVIATTAQTNNNQAKAEKAPLTIQQKIKGAFMVSMQAKSPEKLEALKQELNRVYNNNTQHIILYWRAYLQYYSAIFYLQQGDKEQSEKEIDIAVDWLDKMKNKNTEDYALLSLTQGFAIQFKNMVTVIMLSSKIGGNAQKAIEKDSMNLRGYYAYASGDFYRPERFGGGQKVESYLLKAISLPDQHVKNDYLPSWGKVEAYGLLIRWYIRKENWAKAKLYYNKAIALYPDNYSIKALGKQLKS